MCRKNTSDVFVNSIKKTDFNHLIDSFKSEEIYFDLITTSFSILSSLFHEEKIFKSHFTLIFAIIDIGPPQVLLFLHGWKINPNHHSITCGKMLTENITDSYEISERH